MFGYDPLEKRTKRMLLKMKEIVKRLIKKRGVKYFIVGMALGVDTWSALLILSLKKEFPDIKLICAIPCRDQFKRWKDREAIEIYHDILSKADLVHYVSDEPYTNWCMQDRNKWMVDNSNYALAVWDGSDGGTKNCIKYALKRQRNIIHLHPESLKVELMDKRSSMK